MSKIVRGVQIIREDGTVKFGKQFKQYCLTHPDVRRPAQRFIGKHRYHQALKATKLGYWPNINSPTTFNEKVLHRMFYSDDDLFTKVEFKDTVRDYVTDRVGEDILPEVYHISKDPTTIPFQSLPETYVVKPSIGSGRVIVIDEDDNPNTTEIVEQCREWLSKDHFEYLAGKLGHYWLNRFEPNIIVEERLSDEEYDVPMDYKFYVFHGNVEYIHVDFDRFGDSSRRFFDRDWEPQEFRKGAVSLGPTIDKPKRFEDMIEIAETLGSDFDFIRVDLYNLSDDRIVFGELTVAPAAGQTPFIPKKYDYRLGSLW